MLEMKHEVEDQDQENDKMLKTIKFPKNLGSLNDQLPKPKYDLNKSKSTKIIQLPEESPTSSKLICQTSKKIPLGSMKNINIVSNNMASEKAIGGVTPLAKNMSIKELIAARRPKVLTKCGSQKLIF